MEYVTRTNLTDFEIFGPFPILGTVEATDLKFHMWMNYARY